MPSLPKIRKSTFDTKRQKVVTYVQGGRITIQVDDTGLVSVNVKPWKSYNKMFIKHVILIPNPKLLVLK